MTKVYILTLSLEDDLQQALNALRARHFPPERNLLDAHVTLFHALPEERREQWELDLADISRRTEGFTINVTSPYPLGRGVALRVEAPEVGALHGDLQSRWREFLTPQDQQKRRAHCTIQNKVEPEVARRTLDVIRAGWQPREGTAVGLGLYEYVGGPWRFERRFKFGVV